MQGDFFHVETVRYVDAAGRVVFSEFRRAPWSVPNDPTTASDMRRRAMRAQRAARVVCPFNGGHFLGRGAYEGLCECGAQA